MKKMKMVSIKELMDNDSPEVFECCGTTCDREKSIYQFIALKVLIKEMKTKNKDQALRIKMLEGLLMTYHINVP